jgi:hypothetical protein
MQVEVEPIDTRVPCQSVLPVLVSETLTLIVAVPEGTEVLVNETELMINAACALLKKHKHASNAQKTRKKPTLARQ